MRGNLFFMKVDVIDEISRYVDLDREALLRQGIEAFLKDRKRRLMLDRQEILSRYRVLDSRQLEAKIRSGEVNEHPTWEDLITLENLEEAIAKLDGYLRDLHQAA
ncbi:MAG: hypothetical protein HY695_02580 [Deltaproteobacteria bacterium]|nr:hypothetical protein [Deltaproteobacteria bacterium]